MNIFKQISSDAFDRDDDNTTPNLLEVDIEKIPSAALRRLIEEVRNDIKENISPYSRWHNRHNRSR